MSTTTINATAIDTTNTNDDVVTKLELERYNSCKIWLENIIPKLQKRYIRFIFRYFANITTLTLTL
jgi:hypothetical protein